ncbi:GNAT family N-acetyltransferase [Campylobacter jejuni]|nr:GNAT family N-acetyltransferase [Campylobacter jejuni]MCW1526314.1 GNAT family N-acetyltransferase [Campylobacter jejuni]
MYLVNNEDAEFIFELRSNIVKNKFLNKIDNDINKQREWIRLYKERERNKKEFYFTIRNKNNEKLGLVRLYDFMDDSFCWGSFIIKHGVVFYVSIEVVMNVYEFAFYGLGFNTSHFDVRKDNDRVVAFHKRFGAKIIKEDVDNFYFNISKQEYEFAKEKYKKIYK